MWSFIFTSEIHGEGFASCFAVLLSYGEFLNLCLSLKLLLSSRFLLLWSAVLIMYPTTLAVIALTFSSYILQPVFPNCVPPYMATRMLSATCLRE